MEDDVVVDLDRTVLWRNRRHVDAVASDVVNQIVMNVEVKLIGRPGGVELNPSAGSIVDGVPT